VSFLYLEERSAPMHVGGVSIFEAPQDGFDYDRLVELIRNRIAFVPRYRQRLRWIPGGIANPVWIDDDDVDLDYHIRQVTLTRPGTMDQLEKLVGRLHSSLLDRSRPLWEFFIIDGLQDGDLAFYSKVHHAALDGQAGMKLTLALLDATVASDSFVEVMPAPGVQLLGADGLRTEMRDGAMRIPLGALHAGQHREALVRVRITDPAAFEGHSRSLASVRLRFRDAAEGDLERVQEVVARTQLSNDDGAVARSVNSRTKAIVAIMDASKTQLEAAQRINDGNFVDADKELAKAERTLTAQAQIVTAPAEKRRLEAAAGKVASARAQTRAMPSAPKAVQRENALKLNADAMQSAGF